MSGIRRARRCKPGRALFLFLLLLVQVCVSAVAQRLHVVEPGDTLYALAERYGTTVEELRRSNGLTSSLLTVGQRLELPRQPGYRWQQAEAGGSLADIAARNGLQVDTLRDANPQLPETLPDATAVLIPPADGVTSWLGETETLLDLAVRHGVAPSALLEANGLEGLGAAAPGDPILIPVTASIPVPPPTLAAAPAAAAGSVPAGSSEAPRGATTAGGADRDGDGAATRAAHWHGQRQAELLRRSASLLANFTPASTGFVMPVQGPLSSHFGWRNISVAGNRFHGGIDLAVDTGTPVAAALDGVVSRAGWVGAYGYAVYLDHGDGLQTRYAHLSELLVDVGDVVRQGDTIALAGSTGASTGPHLHFEIRVAGQAVDPLAHLR